MITLKLIKDYYETESGIKDLSIKLRTRDIADVRFCFFVSCKKYTGFSLEKIGSAVNRNHASVINGTKKFNNLYGTLSFTANDVYKKVNKKLEFIEKKSNNDFDLLNCEDIELLKQYYRIKHIEHTNLTHRIINRLNKENKEILSKLDYLPDSLIKAINQLDLQDYDEFIKRTELFIKVKQLLKLKKNENTKKPTPASNMVSL